MINELFNYILFSASQISCTGVMNYSCVWRTRNVSEVVAMVVPELLYKCESRVMLLVSNHVKFREELKKEKVKEKGETPFPIVVSLIF